MGRRVDYQVAFGWHRNKALSHHSFSMTVAESAFKSASVNEKDRVDILIDPESKTGILNFSTTGDFGLSGKSSGKNIKILSAAAAEFLPTVFPDMGKMTELETVSISKKSITFKLP